MKNSILKDKSMAFALRIVKLYRYLCDEQHEYVLSKQILRSGTSIGANIAEAFYAQSPADFIAKLHIARKEAGETAYWLDLLNASSLITNTSYLSISSDCEELLKLLTSSIKTASAKRLTHSNSSLKSYT